jgi:hypothetical protein
MRLTYKNRVPPALAGGSVQTMQVRRRRNVEKEGRTETVVVAVIGIGEDNELHLILSLRFRVHGQGAYGAHQYSRIACTIGVTGVCSRCGPVRRRSACSPTIVRGWCWRCKIEPSI